MSLLYLGSYILKYLPLWKHKKGTKGSLQLVIKAEEVEVEVETWNTSKQSSSHANASYDPQCNQSFAGDTQIEKWT